MAFIGNGYRHPPRKCVQHAVPLHWSHAPRKHFHNDDLLGAAGCRFREWPAAKLRVYEDLDRRLFCTKGQDGESQSCLTGLQPLVLQYLRETDLNVWQERARTLHSSLATMSRPRLLKDYRDLAVLLGGQYRGLRVSNDASVAPLDDEAASKILENHIPPTWWCGRAVWQMPKPTANKGDEESQFVEEDASHYRRFMELHRR